MHCVCINQNLDIFKALYTKLDDKDIMDEEWRKLVHYAAVNNSDDILKFLVEEGHDLNARDEHQKTPLMLSCLYGKPNCANFLLSQLTELEICVKNKDCWMAVHLAAYYGHLEVLKQFSSEKFKKVVKQKGPEK